MLKVELGVAMIETRGRPPSDENMQMKNMPVGASFVSSKRRETLYQIARALGVRVRILAETKKTWRVWKRADHRIPKIPKTEQPKEA